jgi:hypothetical protein
VSYLTLDREPSLTRPGVPRRRRQLAQGERLVPRDERRAVLDQRCSAAFTAATKPLSIVVP